MTRVWMGVPMAMAIAGAATLAAAQTPGAGAQVNTENQQKVTVVGCLQKGDQARGSSAAGQSATSTAAQAEFVLTNARMGGSGSASGAAATGTTAGGRQNPQGTTGTTGTADRATADMKYVLEGRNDELAKHVGHQIEVTGSLSASASQRSSAGTTGTGGAAGRADEPQGGVAGRPDQPQGGATSTPRSSTGAQAHASADQRLQVSSIRMISANCEK